MCIRDRCKETEIILSKCLGQIPVLYSRILITVATLVLATFNCMHLSELYAYTKCLHGKFVTGITKDFVITGDYKSEIKCDDPKCN